MLGRAFLATAFLLAGSTFAKTSATCDDVFTAPFESGRKLEIDLRSGDYEILGTAEKEVRVVCRLDDHTRVREVRIGLDGQRLTIDGGPNNGVHIKIYVPQRTHVDVDCPAGNVTLTDIEGDKYLRVRAGNLTVKGARPEDYSRVDASVTAGNVHARSFGGEKSGLFRSLSKNNPNGKYRLTARVSAGNITIH